MHRNPMSEGEAEQLGNRVFDLDKSIYALSIVDGVGQLIWQTVGKNLPESAFRQEPSESSLKNYPAQVAIVSSMFKLAEDPLGKSKFIISVHEALNFVIFPMSGRNSTMITLVSADADAFAIAKKIHAIL